MESLEKPIRPTRDDAWALLCEYTASENLRKHALAVEACVRAYARKAAAQPGAAPSSADEELWGLAALLHDFDYERWPNHEHHPTEGHPSAGASILRERGYPEEAIHAILAHASYTRIPRQSPLDHALFACDEMAGFLTACSLVKPGKTIFEVEPASVKRRMKDKAFARGVSREDLLLGTQELGVPLEEHVAFCIAAMCGVAAQLGLERKAGA
jgi:putative nucleotidyltransferase with HDIG domain